MNSHARSLGIVFAMLAAGCGGDAEPAAVATGGDGARGSGGSAGAQVVTLSNEETEPYAISVNDSWVFWLDSVPGTTIIKRSAKTGGGVTEFGTAGATPDLATDATHVYWMDQGGPFATPVVPNRLFRRSVTLPSTVETIYTSATIGDHAFISLALDSTNVYAADIVGNTVVRIPLSGGAATPLALEVSMPLEVAVASGFAYFTGSIDPSVRRLSGSGASSQTPEPISPESSGTFAVHSGHVYYFTESGIYRVPVEGGSPEELLAETNLNVPAMAVDDSGVYYTMSGPENGDIKRVPLAGGAVETIFDGDPVVSDIALDSTAVYFASKPSSGPGLVSKLAK